MSNMVTKRFSNFKMIEEPCEHILAGEPCYCEYVESDSFGIVGESPVCKDCYDKIELEAQAEIHSCHDCHKKVPASEGVFWRWYDFYAPQGDEPMFICNECTVKPTHINRREKDQRDYNYEMGRD